MMTDWKVGDLALCIDASEARGRLGEDDGTIYVENNGRVPPLSAGRLYTLQRIGLVVAGCFQGLGFAENPGPWLSSRFRKLDPHTEDEDDREVIAHMIYAPVSHDVKQAFAAEKGE